MTRDDRKPFISVYEGAAAAMVGQFVRSWNRDQREWRERNIFRTQGFRPVYRINVKPRQQFLFASGDADFLKDVPPGRRYFPLRRCFPV